MSLVSEPAQNSFALLFRNSLSYHKISNKPFQACQPITWNDKRIAEAYKLKNRFNLQTNPFALLNQAHCGPVNAIHHQQCGMSYIICPNQIISGTLAFASAVDKRNPRMQSQSS